MSIRPSRNYVPDEVWSDLLARLRSQLDSPLAHSAFRGSLIDEKMFAIDVQEWGLENLLEDERKQREPKIGEPRNVLSVDEPPKR